MKRTFRPLMLLLALLLTASLLLSSCVLPGSGNPTGDDTSQSGGDSSGGGNGGGGNGGNGGYHPPISDDGCRLHIDEDGNEACDRCGLIVGKIETPVYVTIDLFAINDLHGRFRDSDNQPGVDELTNYLAGTGNPTLVLSSGDMWQGTFESTLTRGALMTDWMNRVGFVSMTFGNHEFDWGLNAIRDNREKAEFPFLAINVYADETGEIAPFCQASVIREIDGARIGIIGAIGDCYSSISGDVTGGYYFKVRDELTALVKAEAKRLREEEGCDLIIYSLHDGYESNEQGVKQVSKTDLSGYYDTVLSDGYVDIVFEGHTHRSYILRDEYGVRHLQGGAENRGISHAVITFDTANGWRNIDKTEIVGNTTYEKAEPDSTVYDLLDNYPSIKEEENRVLGYNDYVRDSDEVTDLVAQLYLNTGIQEWGETYKIVLGGGYLKLRNPYSLPAGTLTLPDLCSILPFDNQLVLCSVGGYDLRQKFFETENSAYHIAYGDYGNEIRAKLARGEGLNDRYYIVVDTYTSSYVYNHLTEVARYQDGVYARDLLADYIRAGGLTTRGDAGYTLTPLAEILEIGEALAVGEKTARVYYVRATIQSVESDTYGNLYLTDDAGNVLYVYGVSENGTRYDSITDPPLAGDTVILCGRILNYNGTVELYQANLIRE